MVTYSFDRFYVEIIFILLAMDDLKLSSINYDGKCRYLENLDDNNNEEIKTFIKDLLIYCVKCRPYMAFYRIQINMHTKTAHHTLKNKVDLILPKFSDGRKSKRGVFGTIILEFVGLAFEGISSFLHSRRHKALHKAVHTMSSKVDIQRNKLMHLENTLVMYGFYNTETLEKCTKTVHVLHSRQSMHEKLFAGQVTKAYKYYSQMHEDCGIQHYAINSMLYLRTMKDKYIEMYNKFISQLHNYANAIKIFAKAYLPISLITPLKLKQILASVKETLIKTTPDYDIVIEWLHLYYNMKSVTSA